MDVVEQLGDVLRRAGFGERGAALKSVHDGVPPAATLAFLGRHEDARLATLLSLFTVDRVVPTEAAAAALQPLPLAALLEAGLIEVHDTGLRGRINLYAIPGGPIVAGHAWRDAADASFVASATPASRTVARLAVGRQGGSALEAGCGAGPLALLAARRADRATGIDASSEALRIARMNQRLNGTENVTWAQGDWFQPVVDQRFELVLANPPFAISPDNAFLYRDSTFDGDELSRQVVRDSAAHLSDGGFATVLCNWIHDEGEWEPPVRDWVTDLGCDALLLHFESQDPLRYAMAWNSETGVLGPDEYATAVGRWVEHLRRTGVEQVGLGAVVLRRRAGAANWVRGFHLDHGGPSGAAEPQLRRIFAGVDFLTLPAGEQFKQLLASPWRLVDGHRLDQTLTFRNGAYEPAAAVARQDPGLNLSAQVDMRTFAVLAACNGTRPLKDVIERTAIPEGLDRRGFHSLCLAQVRDLLARGFLVGDPLRGDLSASADCLDRAGTLAGVW